MGAADEVFFREYDARSPGARRSLDRARVVLARAGLLAGGPEILTVVGSKGKGTTAVYASASLVAAGRRVVTLTSPSLRRPTERIRRDGAAVDEATLAALGERVEALRPPRTTGAGYLSPSGLFLAAALLHAREAGADTVVLEAGRGGRSDEVGLLEPAVVAVAPILAEHLAELGGSLESVVADKLGVLRPGTRAVVVGSQQPASAALIRAALPRYEEPGRGDIPAELLPPGLGAGNARLGYAAATRLLGHAPDPEALAAVLGTVRLPGRLSLHRVPGTGSDLLVDAAVSRAGFAAAAGYAAARLGGADRVLLSLPDDKDLAGAVAVFGGAPVVFVTVTAPHLRYTLPLPPQWTRVPAGRVDRAYLAGLGARLLGLGTVSFVGHLLEVVGADTATAFRPPGRPGQGARRYGSAGL